MDRVRYSYVLTLLILMQLLWARRSLLANICGDFGPLDPIPLINFGVCNKKKIYLRAKKSEKITMDSFDLEY